VINNNGFVAAPETEMTSRRCIRELKEDEKRTKITRMSMIIYNGRRDSPMTSVPIGRL